MSDTNTTRLNDKIERLEQRVLNARSIEAAQEFHRQLDLAREQRAALASDATPPAGIEHEHAFVPMARYPDDEEVPDGRSCLICGEPEPAGIDADQLARHIREGLTRGQTIEEIAAAYAALSPAGEDA